ncbi:hypothetical protein [Pontibacterium sp.]|uniref:hypothetical protein n=1 Tax=Pontibacterium sp. TaxID=2036026 RepID=UPI003565AEAA
MSKDSIVTDESAQHDAVAEEQEIRTEATEEGQSDLDPRAALMADIAARRSQERAEENGIEQDDDAKQEDEELEEREASPDSQDKGEAKSPAGTPVFERDGQSFVRLKIDGQEVEQTLDKVLATAQKHGAADARLNEAAQRYQHLQKYEQDLTQREQQLAKLNDQKPPEQGAEDIADLAKQHAEAIYEGDQEAAAEILGKMLNAGRQPATPSIDPNQVAEQATASAMEQVRIQMHNAEVKRINDNFSRDYSDVVKDDDLYSMAKIHAKKLRTENPDKSLEEVMTETGEHIRNWKASIQKQDADKARKERKRRAAKSVSGTNQSASIGEDKAPPPTRSQTIRNMRKGRAGAN